MSMMAVPGAPKLLNCEPGYLLVNNTINTQECLFCQSRTYSISPFDRCSRAKGYCDCLLYTSDAADDM
eukprot:1078694-Rhodomonas_salina.2